MPIEVYFGDEQAPRAVVGRDEKGQFHSFFAKEFSELGLVPSATRNFLIPPNFDAGFLTAKHMVNYVTPESVGVVVYDSMRGEGSLTYAPQGENPKEKRDTTKLSFTGTFDWTVNFGETPVRFRFKPAKSQLK